MDEHQQDDEAGTNEKDPLVSKSPKPGGKNTKKHHNVVDPFPCTVDFSLQRLVNETTDKDADTGLDDVDGAMFTRPKHAYIDTGDMFNNTGLYDDPDGAMFSRSPTGSNKRRKPEKLRIKKSQYGKHIESQIPRSPSESFLDSARFSTLSANFPCAPFSSAGNLSQYDHVPSDLIDYGLDVVPDNFDSGNNSTKHSQVTNGSIISDHNNDDTFDSALFNRANSIRNKEDNIKPSPSEHENKLNNNDTVLMKEVKKSKSMPNIILHDTPRASPDDVELEQTEQIKKHQPSCSLPDYLNDITDVSKGNSKDDLQIASDNQTEVEDVIKRETFVPLTGYHWTNGNNDVVPVVHRDDDARINLLQNPDQPTRGKRKPFKLKYLGAVMFPAISVVLFVADIGTDINLAMRYNQEGEMLFFIVTLVCILVPSLLMSCVDISWICIDRNSGSDEKADRTSCNNTKWWKAVRIVIGVLSFGRVVRTISHMYHSIRSKMYDDDYTKDLHTAKKIEERRDYCMLDVINAFTESCPQLIAQMVLLYSYRRPFNADLGFSIVLSWLSIGWAYSCYYRYHKESLNGQNDVKLCGIMIFNCAVLSSLATRICIISLFLVYYPFWIGAIVLIIHFIVMFIWIAFCQKPDLVGLTSSCWGRFLYHLFFSYLSIMYFVNLKDTRTRFRILTYFGIYYVENGLAAGFLLWKTSFDYRTSVTEFRWSLLIVPLGTVMHVGLLILFYKCFHPAARGVERNRDDGVTA